MQEISLSKIKIIPDIQSVRREKINDEVYFSSEYSDYISNSRLKLINPDQDGSPSKYKNGFTDETTTSLSIGSVVHELLLQPDKFELGPDLNKPNAKLGLVVDVIKKARKHGKTIYESILEASSKVDYYEGSLNNKRIRKMLESGFQYYWNSRNIKDDVILLSNKDRETVDFCLWSLKNHKRIVNLLFPKDIFDSPVPSYNEDAFFINLNCTLDNKNCTLKLKMKADNWTLNTFDKILTLNDLKTTGHGFSTFMDPNGSFKKFHYARQFAFYRWILEKYCEKECGYDKSWTTQCNVIVVETCPDNRAGIYPVADTLIVDGFKEFVRLLKMVAYCEMTEYSDDIIFI